MAAYRMPPRHFGALFALVLLVVLVVPATTRQSGAQAAAGFAGVSAGGSLSGVANIEALASGDVVRVIFHLTGPQERLFTDRHAPFFFNGDTRGTPHGWNTSQVPDGAYTLSATLIDTHGNSQIRQVSFLVANAGAPPVSVPTAAPTSVPTAPPVSVPTAAPVSVPTAAPVPAGSFLETFDGDPTSPQPWSSPRWDITVHSRDIATWDSLEPMQAGHGADCAPTPATHTVTRYEDAVFNCKNHLMTAIKAEGYGAIYLTPNQLLDFSSGTATVRWDMSTQRTSARDWVDLWITPYDEQLQAPVNSWVPDLSGEPRDAIHIELTQRGYLVSVINNFVVTQLDTLNWVDVSTFLTPDSKRRDTFELKLTPGHIRFGMPAYNFYWADTALPSLSWSRGVVQFSHHSYNPQKADGCLTVQVASTADCKPNTWHWDNISLSPVVPFTIIPATQRVAQPSQPSLSFAAGAPANAHLRFMGIGAAMEVSFDGGHTWQAAQLQAQSKQKSDSFLSYWMPIPAGVQQVQFRSQGWYGGAWRVRDASLWAPPAS